MQPFNLPRSTVTHHGMRAARVIAYCALVALLLLLAIRANTSNTSEIYSHGGVGSVEDYLSSNPNFPGAYEFHLLGIAVRNGQGTLQDGHEFSGVEIIGVIPGSPAAAAGLKSQRRQLKTIMTLGIIGAAIVFPPALMGLNLLESSQIGESHEFILAVDAMRTRDVSDFATALEQAKPGQIVYLTMVRNNQREQLSVPLPGGRLRNGSE